jgi:hypothetical protein
MSNFNNYDYTNNYDNDLYHNYVFDKILSNGKLGLIVGGIILLIFFIYIIIDFIRHKSIKGKIINIYKRRNNNTLQDKFPYNKFPYYKFPFLHELEIEFYDNNIKKNIILYRYYRYDKSITEIKNNPIFIYYDTFFKKYKYGGNSIIIKK